MAGLTNLGSGLLRINPLSNQIEYSGDGGYNWTQRSDSSQFGTLNDILTDGNAIFVCGSEGLFVSRNDGYSFSMIASKSSYGEFLRLSGNQYGLYAQTSRGLHKSSDGGHTWTLVHY